MTLLRVMTYNILLGGRRGQPLYDVVRAVAPDVLLVNEGPKRPVLDGRDCRRLADRLGLRYVVGGRAAGGNLVLRSDRVEVRSSSRQVIAQPPFRPRRGVAAAQLRVEGRLVGVVSCHLSLDAASRRTEVAEVLAAAGRLRGPVVLAGDLNEPPDGPCWAGLRAAGFADHGQRGWPTFPADRPRARIDALLVRGAVTVRSHGDPGVPAEALAAASDHRPVLAELEPT